MSQIESVVWNRALQWDATNLNISRELPAVMYAAPLTSRIEPTRKAVRDPELMDTKISGEIIFSTRRFMNPMHLKRNLSLVDRWLSKNGDAAEKVEDWLHIENPDLEQVLELIQNWSTKDQERLILRGVSELFGDGMGSLGLSEIPVSIFVTEKVLNADLGSPSNLGKLISRVKFGRTVSGSLNQVDINLWKSAVLDDAAQGAHFDELAITHIGGSQRKLRDRLDYDASIVVIEFMNGYKSVEGVKTQISLGLAMSILSPGGYDVRVIGHSN